MESGQLDRSDSQRPSAQFLLADAVISTEMRLTTRELPPERTAGPYSPDSHCQSGLLECATARVSWAMQCFVYTNLSRFMGAMYSNGTHETSDVPRSEISGHHVIMRLVPKERNVNLAFLWIAEDETSLVRNVHAAAYITCEYTVILHNTSQQIQNDNMVPMPKQQTLSWRWLVYAVLWQKLMLLLCKCHIAAITRRSFRNSFLAGENCKYWKSYNWITCNLINLTSVYLNKLCSAGNVTTVPATECPQPCKWWLEPWPFTLQAIMVFMSFMLHACQILRS